MIILGESLGGVESLIEHPHTMTHASVAGTRLEVPGDLIRLSVGIEDIEDLIADLDRALPAKPEGPDRPRAKKGQEAARRGFTGEGARSCRIAVAAGSCGGADHIGTMTMARSTGRRRLTRRWRP